MPCFTEGTELLARDFRSYVCVIALCHSREHTGKAIFVPRGKLLCKVEYVKRYSKYVSKRDRSAKYTQYILD